MEETRNKRNNANSASNNNNSFNNTSDNNNQFCIWRKWINNKIAISEGTIRDRTSAREIRNGKGFSLCRWKRKYRPRPLL